MGGGRWRVIGGQRIFVTVRGAGPPVLALHGFPTSSYDYSHLLPLISEHHQVLLFDYPGFGFSEKPLAGTYSLFRYADIAQALLADAGHQRVYVLAHDIGDSVALELLRRRSIAVERLVLLNGSVVSFPLQSRAMLLIQHALLSPRIGPWVSRLRLLRRPIFAKLLAPLFARPLSAPELTAFWALLRYNGGTRIYHLLIRYMQERWQHQQRWLDALAAHSAPLTLIWGQADPVAIPAVAEHVAALRPDAAYVRLANIGHYPHWEDPRQVAQAVLEAFG